MMDIKAVCEEGQESGKDLGRVEAGETTIRIYCMKKEYTSNKRGEGKKELKRKQTSTKSHI